MPLGSSAGVGAQAWVAQARTLLTGGDIAGAWAVCSEAAGRARRRGDGTALAEIALVIRAPADLGIRACVHALACEALPLLGVDEDALRARLLAQVAATRDPFYGAVDEFGELQSETSETTLLDLQAAVGRLQNPRHVESRLLLARRAVALGRAAADLELEAWGRRWRMDALAELGRRADLADELRLVSPLADALGPEWRSWVLLVRASTRLLEGRFADTSHLLDTALAVGGASGLAGYFDLVFRSEIARTTGVGLDGVAVRVREAVDGLPYLAKGWLALVLGTAGKREESEELWRAIRPHVGRVPHDAPELLPASAGHAELCRWFDDEEVASAVYDQLVDYDGLHVIGLAHGPYGGPVSLTLGRLALVVGRPDDARHHLEAALAQSQAVQAAGFTATAHAELARSFSPSTRGRSEHARAALSAAQRLGMHPLTDAVAPLAAGVALSFPGLTPREWEVALLVADGLTNAQIAQRLVLSLRTVENHISHLLHKRGLSTRTALAVWAKASGPTKDK